jgi:hypothetical protein
MMPFHEDQLPELAPPQERFRLSSLGNWQITPKIALKRGKLVYETQPYTATMGARGIGLRGPVGGINLDTQVKYSGDWQINGSMPLLGGNLGFNAQDTDGQRRYGLRYERSFR